MRITDDAIIAAVHLSSRYITNRFLPDKAIDLMDEAMAHLRMQIDSVPEKLDTVERNIQQLEIEREAIKKDKESGRKLEEINKEISELKEKADVLKSAWRREKEHINKIQQLKIDIENYKFQAERAEREVKS